MISLIFIGLLTLSSGAYAQPAQSDTATVSTFRSDGAVFRAVSQVTRRQTRRSVRISGSAQALSNRAVAASHEEHVTGGRFVTPSAGVPHALENAPQQLLYPMAILTPDVMRHRKPKHRN